MSNDLLANIDEFAVLNVIVLFPFANGLIRLFVIGHTGTEIGQGLGWILGLVVRAQKLESKVALQNRLVCADGFEEQDLDLCFLLETVKE